jgi:hypothetical protein
LTVFETLLADGLMAGLSANKVFFIFLRKYVSRTCARTIGKDVFHFLENPVAERHGRRPSAEMFFIFFKKITLPSAPGHYLGKSGNTRTEKIVPRVAERNV